MIFNKKEKRDELFGAYGKSIDYCYYHMSFMEKLTGGLAGLIAGTVSMYIMFDILWFAVFMGIGIGFAGIKIYHSMLIKKRNKALRIQFKDMLESLSTSLGAGRNVPDAMADARKDMLNQYGEASYIVSELSTIINGMRDNILIEDLLTDFGIRSDNEDIISFGDVFRVANRQGGNLKQIIYETKSIISQKIDIEMEIETVISGNKNELNIMMVMPLVIVTATKGFINNGEFSVTNFAVKIIALIMFVLAYLVGVKIMEVKV